MTGVTRRLSGVELDAWLNVRKLLSYVSTWSLSTRCRTHRGGQVLRCGCCERSIAILMLWELTHTGAEPPSFIDEDQQNPDKICASAYTLQNVFKKLQISERFIDTFAMRSGGTRLIHYDDGNRLSRHGKDRRGATHVLQRLTRLICV